MYPVRPVVLNGGVVSSTRIRTLILAGNMEEAAALLGRAYGLTGTVVPGMQQDKRSAGRPPISGFRLNG